MAPPAVSLAVCWGTLLVHPYTRAILLPTAGSLSQPAAAELVLGLSGVFTTVQRCTVGREQSPLRVPAEVCSSAGCCAMQVTCPCLPNQPPCLSQMTMILRPCPSEPPSPLLWPVNQVSAFSEAGAEKSSEGSSRVCAVS